MLETIPVTSFRPEMLLSLLFGVVFVSTAIYARTVSQGGRPWWILSVLLVGLLIAAFQIEIGLTHTLLMDAAVFAAVGLVWSSAHPKARQAAQLYLVMAVSAMLCVTIAFLLTGELWGGEGIRPAHPLDQVIVALLLIGFAIKLAFIPLYFWLPGVAVVSSPMTIALIVGTLDIAELSELFTLRIHMPWVFNEYFGLWLGIALLSMFGGALLALGQTDLKRMLAFSTIDDMGYLLIGVLAGTQLGFAAVLLGAMSHSIFKVILFGSVGVAEQGMGRPITLAERGLAARYPLSAAAFILAALGFLGVPPLFGFLGRWRLYLTGLQIGGFALGLAMVAATSLALFYYVRAIHLVWLGQPSAEKSGREPKQAAGVLIALIVLALLLGLFPGLLVSAM
jgi:multicomponent Na+:H+ antiporter subunit D